MMKLYFTPGSSSMAAHIALHEVGATFAAAPILLGPRGTQTPEFLALNPEGKVPVLVINGRPLTEVAAILFFLGRSFPKAGLLPTSIEDQAQVISWMSFAASSLHPARRRGVEFATTIYQIADHRLNGREWAVGSYSIADIHLFRLFWRFNASLRPLPSSLPNLFAHHERMLARDAVKRTIKAESEIGYDLPR